MRKTSPEEKIIASEIKALDSKMKKARDADEHAVLEKEMAVLMQKLLLKMRSRS
ncbi:MAG: hypothetical protein AAFU64_00085 [Bacteroidota bacterium]